MAKIDIEQRLKDEGLTEKQIDKFFFYYKRAVDEKILYPYYYALANVII
ncbi:hypothetical protein [Methanoculleus sp.]|jgi:hypothetical protein|nr:hypothetical protein [Methanoculleus sp.]MCK9320184.1 hypothetical protein [Methanoculleus sp.]